MNAEAIMVFRNITKMVKICSLAGLPNVKLCLHVLILWAYIELCQLVFTYLYVKLVSSVYIGSSIFELCTR